MADTLMFLRVTGPNAGAVQGESTRTGYEDQIEIESFSWSVKAKHSTLQRGEVKSQLEWGQLTVSKFFDRASTGLYQLMVGKPGSTSGTPYVSALLSVVDMVMDSQRTTGVPVMTIELKDGYIEDIKLAVSESGKSMQAKESVVLSYRTVELTYFKATDDRVSRAKPQVFQGEAASVDG